MTDQQPTPEPKANAIEPSPVPCSFEVNSGDVNGVPVVELRAYSFAGTHVLYLPPELATDLGTLLLQQAKVAREAPPRSPLIVPQFKIDPDKLKKAIENGDNNS